MLPFRDRFELKLSRRLIFARFRSDSIIHLRWNNAKTLSKRDEMLSILITCSVDTCDPLILQVSSLRPTTIPSQNPMDRPSSLICISEASRNQSARATPPASNSKCPEWERYFYSPILGIWRECLGHPISVGCYLLTSFLDLMMRSESLDSISLPDLNINWVYFRNTF
jgi:hypothetical protein